MRRAPRDALGGQTGKKRDLKARRWGHKMTTLTGMGCLGQVLRGAQSQDGGQGLEGSEQGQEG